MPIVVALFLVLHVGQTPPADEPPEGEPDEAAEPAKPSAQEEKKTGGEVEQERRDEGAKPEPAAPPRVKPIVPEQSVGRSAMPPPSGTEAAPSPAEEPPARVTPESQDFFQFSDYVDNRLTFVFSNKNVFAGPGERQTPTSGYRIGVDPDFKVFFENINTRFLGYESLSHLVLYKKLPGFWPLWETEAALAALVLVDTDTGRFNYFDSGTYLRVIRKLGDGPEDQVGSFDLTAWPISADRFRLGYTYLISWGGTAIFPGKLQTSSLTEGAVPGIRFRWRAPEGKSYAYAGFKSALLLSRKPGVTAGEQVPNYAVLLGGGHTFENTFVLESNGGFFQKGTQERPGLEGNRINAFGISARASIVQGIAPRESLDYRLYRNDPTYPIDYLLYQEFRPGSGFNISLEGSYLTQNLENPDRFGSEKLVNAISAGLVANAKLEELVLTAYAFYQSIDFILFNVPGFVPFQAVPSNATTKPEFFFAAAAEYVFESLKFRPLFSVGLKIPATYHGEIPPDQGVPVSIAQRNEVRTQIVVDDITRIVLPAGSGATPIFGALLKLPFALSRSMAVAGEVRFELNDNQPRIAKDNELGQVTTFFDKPYRLSLAVLLQSKW